MSKIIITQTGSQIKCPKRQKDTLRALGLAKPLMAVKHTRQLRKTDMVRNGATPVIEVDPETYAVRADGELLVCEPAAVLPLAQRYFLF